MEGLEPFGQSGCVDLARPQSNSICDVSGAIRVLPATAPVKFLQLLQSFDIAVSRCCPQQDSRLLAILWDTIALQVKLCKPHFRRSIASSNSRPELSCERTATRARIRIRRVLP
jgi:hypothetical protein